MFTAKDAWLGPSMDLGLAAVYNLQMDPGEQYDMTFNGAAPRVAGQITTSPGRYSGSDNGWSYGYMTKIVNEFNATLKKYPNIPTIPASASIGADLPVFTRPNLAPVQK